MVGECRCGEDYPHVPDLAYSKTSAFLGTTVAPHIESKYQLYIRKSNDKNVNV